MGHILLKKKVDDAQGIFVGAESKYRAPRRKFLVVSVTKNCLAVAALPPH